MLATRDIKIANHFGLFLRRLPSKREKGETHIHKYLGWKGANDKFKRAINQGSIRNLRRNK